MSQDLKKGCRVLAGAVCLLGAAVSGLVFMASIMGDRNPDLPPMSAAQRNMPLFMMGAGAAFVAAAVFLLRDIFRKR